MVITTAGAAAQLFARLSRCLVAPFGGRGAAIFHFDAHADTFETPDWLKTSYDPGYGVITLYRYRDKGSQAAIGIIPEHIGDAPPSTTFTCTGCNRPQPPA